MLIDPNSDLNTTVNHWLLQLKPPWSQADAALCTQQEGVWTETGGAVSRLHSEISLLVELHHISAKYRSELQIGLKPKALPVLPAIAKGS